MASKVLDKHIDQVLAGDCLQLLRDVPSSSVDLIVTSPPYADQRERVYGGISPDKYVDWFLPISKELFRVLKPKGSFVLNIKERVVEGQRHPYVIQLILEMRAQQKWRWTEEYCWHKKNSSPGWWPNRFRDSWERCLHFTKEKVFNMYHDAVKVETGEWSKSRLKKLSDNDKKRMESRVKSGFGKRVANWVGRDKVYPSNVLHMATECYNRSHCAAFPLALPEWFIKLFTKEGDVVLDPFIGSGTTAVAAVKHQRHYIGFDRNAEFVEIAKERIAKECGLN